jgi:hypothetical protein
MRTHCRHAADSGQIFADTLRTLRTKLRTQVLNYLRTYYFWVMCDWVHLLISTYIHIFWVMHQGTDISQILDPTLGEVVRSSGGVSDFFKDIKKSWCDKNDVTLYQNSLWWRHMTSSIVAVTHHDTSTSTHHPFVLDFGRGKKVRKCTSLRFFVLWGSPGSNVIFFLEGVRLFSGKNIF